MGMIIMNTKLKVFHMIRNCTALLIDQVCTQWDYLDSWRPVKNLPVMMKLKCKMMLMIAILMTYLVMSSNPNKTGQSEFSKRRKEKLLRSKHLK